MQNQNKFQSESGGVKHCRLMVEGRIQERYGYAKDKTRKAVDEWLHSLNQRS